MIKSRAIFAAGAVFLSAALAASFFLVNKPAGKALSAKPSPAFTIPSNIKDSDVLTWDCEYPTYKPETIMIYCGDGGAYIQKITWSAWGESGAMGKGEYYKNLCEPDCADGKMVHAPVSLSLSNLTPRKGKFYLRTLDMRSLSGKDFPWAESGFFKWDVMEFAEQMNRD
jgi:hypothetical protein